MKNIWNMIEGFTPKEDWGSAENMNGFTLMLLSFLRKRIREKDPEARVYIHAGFARDGHSKNSQHYKGNAVDFHFVTSMSYPLQIQFMLDSLKELQVHNKVGFGIYPDWNSPGFHIDDRGDMARWGYIDGVIHFGLDGFAKTFDHAIMKFAA